LTESELKVKNEMIRKYCHISIFIDNQITTFKNCRFFPIKLGKIVNEIKTLEKQN